MPGSTAQGFRQLEKMDRRPIPRAIGPLYLSIVCSRFLPAGDGGSALPAGPLGAACAGSLDCGGVLAAGLAANLFQPGADTAYPLLSTSALALAGWAAGREPTGSRYFDRPGAGGQVGVCSCFRNDVHVAGVLPVGLIVALVMGSCLLGQSRTKGWIDRGRGHGVPVAHGAGLDPDGCQPVIVWTWNLKNHARFYVEYPRTYLAWLAINPIELAIAMGLPAALW